MSRAPSRFETYKRPRPSAVNTGESFRWSLSVSWMGVPPVAGTSQIVLGAMLDVPPVPTANAIMESFGDQVGECAPNPVVRVMRRDVPRTRSRDQTPTVSAYAIRLPSCDQSPRLSQFPRYG